MNFPEKKLQIEAILKWVARDFALGYVALIAEEFHGKIISVVPYEKVFNITRKEIYEYTKTHYKITDLVSPYPKEGLFAKPEGGGFLIYEQDYGRVCSPPDFVNNENELLNYYIDFVIRRSSLNSVITKNDQVGKHI